MENKNDLKTAAKETFDANPKIDALHVTSDGMCFEKSEGEGIDMGLHHANNHARTLADQSVVVITKAEIYGERKAKLSFEEKIAQINACTTEEELTAIEIANNERKEVKAAFTAKLAEFKK